ncbi:hypothetical protein CRENBAI_024791 [Crenichthys baileyi]|uniref:Uncharacterized protein n=1 Tax=Crenichthys baileyi TaxID=28760 RepID=A0AAV9REG4_9TELE
MRPLVYPQVVTSKSVSEIFAAGCEIHFSVFQVMHRSLKSRPRIFCCTISLLHLIYTLIMFQQSSCMQATVEIVRREKKIETKVSVYSPQSRAPGRLKFFQQEERQELTLSCCGPEPQPALAPLQRR